MKFSTLALLSLATTADAAKGKKSSAASGNPQPGNFKVALWGDLPYLGSEVNVFDGQYGPYYAALRDTVNRAGVDFAVHMGDVKGGSSPCGELNYKRFEDFSNALSVPSLLTLGDNGWTDCHRLNAGNYDPLGRLALMRERFFSSYGGNVMGAGFINTDVPDSDYPENQVFVYGNVVHTIAHVVGSNNALYDGIDQNCDQYLAIMDPGCHDATAEYEGRNAAVNQLIRNSFALAKNEGLRAVMIYIQANIFGGPCGTVDDTPACAENQFSCACCDITKGVYISTGFQEFWSNLVNEAGSFDGKVVLVHGDSHYFQIYPMPTGIPSNIIAVQVPGSGDIGWVEAEIDTTSGYYPEISFTMYNNRPDTSYYASCPNSPNLELLDIVPAGP